MRQRYGFRNGALLFGSGFLGIILLGITPNLGLAEVTPHLLQQYPQATGMAGYVLNSETNMNRTYSRRLEQQLLHGNQYRLPNEPLIRIEGQPVSHPPLEQPPMLLNPPKPPSTSPRIIQP
jgi:hypothetical protein